MALFSYLLFTAGDALVKWLQAGYHASQIIVFIHATGFVTMSTIAIRTRGLRQAYQSKKWPWHMIRAAVITTSSILVYYALKHLPLSDFYGIVFLNPLWVAILSFLFLKEKIPPSRIIAILVGFLGVLIIAGSEFATFNFGFFAALCVSILGAIGALLARHIGGNEAPTNFGLATHAAMTLTSLPFMIMHYKVPSMLDAGLMIGCGAAIAIAMMSLSVVFAKSHSVSQVAPLQYTQMLWGILFGWLIFNQIPTEQTLMGGLLVIVAGFYVMQSLRRGRLMNR